MRARRSRLAVLDDDEPLRVTTKPIKLRGSVRMSRPRTGELAGFLGVPWWLWVLSASGGVAVLVWWLASRGEPDPEENPVPPDSSSSSPDVDLLDIGGGHRLERNAAIAFIAMRNAAKAVAVELSVSTAWRSLAHQQRLYDAYIAFKEGRGAWAPLAAKPGATAPHQRGIALDLNGVDPRKTNFDSRRRAWLDDNGAIYGWKNTGSKFGEPWHWEFVGVAGVA